MPSAAVNGHTGPIYFGDKRLAPWFWSKVTPEPNSGCWLWLGDLSVSGYGRVKRDGLRRQAHRIFYEALVGPIAPGLVSDHLCRVRPCVNPAHIRSVTSRENTFAPGSLSIAAKNAAKTHCKHGHALSGRNLAANARQRRCRECTKLNKRASVARIKLAQKGRI